MRVLATSWWCDDVWVVDSTRSTVAAPCTMPAGFALIGVKADEQATLVGILDEDPDLTRGRDGHTVIGGPGATPAETTSRPGPQPDSSSYHGPPGTTPNDPGAPCSTNPYVKAFDRTNDIFDGQLVLEHHE